MASKIPGGGKVTLNRKGMGELLKSRAIAMELYSRMQRVQSALPGSEIVGKIGKARAKVQVWRGSDYEEANTGELSRALDLAGGRRGDKTMNQLAKRRTKNRPKG